MSIFHQWMNLIIADNVPDTAETILPKQLSRPANTSFTVSRPANSCITVSRSQYKTYLGSQRSTATVSGTRECSSEVRRPR